MGAPQPPRPTSSSACACWPALFAAPTQKRHVVETSPTSFRRRRLIPAVVLLQFYVQVPPLHMLLERVHVYISPFSKSVNSCGVWPLTITASAVYTDTSAVRIRTQLAQCQFPGKRAAGVRSWLLYGQFAGCCTATYLMWTQFECATAPSAPHSPSTRRLHLQYGLLLEGWGGEGTRVHATPFERCSPAQYARC